MKRMRIMGLCLVAVFAFSAMAAVSASALPEVGRCVAKAGGKYKTETCTTKAGSKAEEKKFEFLKGAKSETSGVNFTASGGEGTLETVSGTKITCKTQAAVGKYDQDTGAIKEVEGVVATFTGCELPLLALKCNTKGKAAEEIVTNTLQGPLGYISGEKTTSPVVGQELTPAVKKGAFAEFECGAGAVNVVVKEGTVKPTGLNCIIAPLAEVNVMATTVKQTYSGSGGVQSPQKFQNKTTICNLESSANKGPFERSTQALETTITNEEALEVKA